MDIDSVMGNFDVEMRIHLYNITQAPFGTIKEAFDTVYRNSSRTSMESSGRKDFNFYRLHEEELEGAWELATLDNGETVHPDGLCSPKVLSTIKPISMDAYSRLSPPRLPFSEPLKGPTFIKAVPDDSGNLKYLDVKITINFKPLNPQFVPFQVDLLDIYNIDMPSSSLIHVDQEIIENILCVT